ncbi:unnamed protein product [Cochlearia groenlandica]
MSTKIRMMVFVMNLLPLFFSAAVFCYGQSLVPQITLKISENVTYDCIDIYKQPGLDHPMLKTHKIQMKPSVSKVELKDQTRNNKKYNEKNIGCPHGTVPILRNTKEFFTNSQTFAKKYFNPLSVDSPGTHIAGVISRKGPFFGIEAMFSGYTLNIEKDQASYSQIYLGSGVNNQANFISAGWMINPGLFGDNRIWTYGFWKGVDGKGCYNTACPGFVQVSNIVPIVQPNDLKPEIPSWLRYSIHKDKMTGNWWITQRMHQGTSVDIGYWPKELFNLLGKGANMVGTGGAVQASPSGSSPPMGNGNFPSKDKTKSAIFSNIEALDSKYGRFEFSSFEVEKLIDNDKCYGIMYGKGRPFVRNRLGFFFNYGGPGGNSCGV